MYFVRVVPVVVRAVVSRKKLFATLIFLIDMLPENFEWVVFVILSSRIVVHRNPELVVHTCLIELVGVKSRVFRLCGVFGLSDSTMHPINGNQEYWNIVVSVAGSPALGPYRSRMNKTVLVIKTLTKTRRSVLDLPFVPLVPGSY